MKRQYSTIRHNALCALTFVIFACIFGTIGMALMLVGIYWAFQTFFTVGWWASLLIVFGLLVIYVTALSFALGMLRGDNDETEA